MTSREERDLNPRSRSSAEVRTKQTGRAERTPRAWQRAAADGADATRTYRWGRRKGQPRPHPKLRARAAAVRRRPWRVVAALAVVLALIAGVIYLFGYSSAFEVEEITVSGADGEVAELAQTTAATQLGRPLARVDTDAVEEQVLQDLRVATAEVQRDWPSGLTLELTLREPALAITQDGAGAVQLVDAHGVVYDTVDKAPKGLPTARVRIRGDELDPELLVALQTLPQAVPTKIAQQIEGLTLTSEGEITFTVGTIEVLWGDGHNGQLKGRVLEGLLAQEGIDPEAESLPAGPIVIDLTTPATPVVTGLPLEEPS